ALFGGQILRARGFGQAPHAAPNVEFPRQRKSRLRIAISEIRAWRNKVERTDRRSTGGAECARSVECRKLSGTRDAVLRASFEYVFGGNGEIVVLNERGLEQIRQGGIVKQIER